MDEGRRRPDPPAVATERVRAAVEEAARQAPSVPLLVGGKSFGGRMTSTAQADAPLPGVGGLAFLAFPLHPPGKPGIERAAHLDGVRVPMLFLQGSRDDFARLDLLRSVLTRLGPRASLHLLEGGDHSFRVKGRKADTVLTELVEQVAQFADKLAASV
jgi:predicted alpha/beta-hydrolase family hydrolase